MYFSNSCNKCLDSNNDEINEILLESAWILLLEGRWNDEYTFKTPFLKGTSDIEMNRIITCNCNNNIYLYIIFIVTYYNYITI